VLQKFLARAGGMVDIAKFSSNIVYHHAKFGRSTFSHTVRVHVKRPKKFLARWYPILLGYGAWLNSRNTPVLHLSYHAEFGRCRTMRVSN